MNLWILRPVKNLPRNRSPWELWYDKCFGFVIRAENEKEAREIAAKERGDEDKKAWLSSEYSTCKVLFASGEKGMIIEDVWVA